MGEAGPGCGSRSSSVSGPWLEAALGPDREETRASSPSHWRCAGPGRAASRITGPAAVPAGRGLCGQLRPSRALPRPDPPPPCTTALPLHVPSASAPPPPAGSPAPGSPPSCISASTAERWGWGAEPRGVVGPGRPRFCGGRGRGGWGLGLSKDVLGLGLSPASRGWTKLRWGSASMGSSSWGTQARCRPLAGPFFPPGPGTPAKTNHQLRRSPGAWAGGGPGVGRGDTPPAGARDRLTWGGTPRTALDGEEQRGDL